MRRVGIGYRRELGAWIRSKPPELGCLEITAEHFFGEDDSLLRDLREDYPLFVHGLGLSLGTAGPLDRETLEDFARVVRSADPLWISEHVAFTRTSEVDLGHLNPIARTPETLGLLRDHCIELRERCGKPLILENITSHLRTPGTMSETEFLNRLCEEAGCGVLLDVTNLFINSRNHRFDPGRWLREIEPKRIVQLHVVGYSVRQNRWEDLHAQGIQQDLWSLIEEALAYAPVQAVIVERDANFPRPEVLAEELSRLEACLVAA